MLDRLAVDLESYKFTANCTKCSSILFEIRIIDQFVRCKGKQNNQYSKDGAKYYLLHASLLPSSITVEKGASFNKPYPFSLLFLSDLKCSYCKQNLGFKLLSVSSEIPHNDLLGRLFIDIVKVRIKTQKQDVTEQLIARFDEQWINQTELESIDFSEINFQKKGEEREKHTEEEKEDKRQQNREEKLGKSNKDRKNTEGKNKKKQSKKRQKENEELELKNLRRQLQLENLENKEIIHEIVTSIDFFNEVLQSLEKRVSQAQTICTVLKDKVEKIVPLLRKKNQQ